MTTSLTWTNTLITKNIEDKRLASMLELENENTLTIDVIMPHIFNFYKDINNSRIMILKAGTGSGKSSTFPYNIWKYFKLRFGSILVAQPRRNTTQSNSTFVAKLNNLTMGKEIGYQNGINRLKPEDPYNMLYITHQIINNIILSSNFENFTSKYPIVLLDEMHESSYEVDLIYFLVKNLINKGCKSLFIFTSATLNEEKIASYFNVKTNIFPLFIHVKGNDENMKVNMFSPKDDDRDIINYIRSALEKTFIFGRFSKNLEKISRKNDDNTPLIDTVIFCPSFQFINNFIKIITELFKNDIDDKNIVIISYNADDGTYNTINEKIYKKMNDDYERISSLIVVGTNVLETGVTIRRLNTVIDTCLKNDRINPIVGNINNVIVQPISESELLQRKGRAGRVGEGNYYSFYTEKSLLYISNHDEIPGMKYPIPKTFITNDFAMNIILTYYQKLSMIQLNKDGIGEKIHDISFDKIIELGKLIKPIYIDFKMINPIPFDIYIESYNYLFKYNLLNIDFSLSINGLISDYFNNKIIMTSLIIKYLIQGVNSLDIIWILSLLDKYENFELKFIKGIPRNMPLNKLIVSLKNLVQKDLNFEKFEDNDFQVIGVFTWDIIQKNFIDVFITVYNFINKFNYIQNNYIKSYFNNEIDELKINFDF